MPWSAAPPSPLGAQSSPSTVRTGGSPSAVAAAVSWRPSIRSTVRAVCRSGLTQTFASAGPSRVTAGAPSNDATRPDALISSLATCDATAEVAAEGRLATTLTQHSQSAATTASPCSPTAPLASRHFASACSASRSAPPMRWRRDSRLNLPHSHRPTLAGRALAICANARSARSRTSRVWWPASAHASFMIGVSFSSSAAWRLARSRSAAPSMRTSVHAQSAAASCVAAASASVALQSSSLRGVSSSEIRRSAVPASKPGAVSADAHAAARRSHARKVAARTLGAVAAKAPLGSSSSALSRSLCPRTSAGPTAPTIAPHSCSTSASTHGAAPGVATSTAPASVGATDAPKSVVSTSSHSACLTLAGGCASITLTRIVRASPASRSAASTAAASHEPTAARIFAGCCR